MAAASVEDDPAPPRSHNRRKRLRLSDEAAEHVRELIVSGQLRAGEFIRPEALAEELDISATPAREGLLSLANEGFLVVEPRRGFIVTALSSTDVTDLYAAQALLGGELAARAAKVMDDNDIATLESIQSRLEKAARVKDYDSVELLNHEFHAYIYRCGGSRKIRWLIKTTLAYAPRKFFAVVPGWPRASARDHRSIIDRLRDHDPEGARQAMATHICNAGALLAEHVAR